ncbi:hypothetical protein [Cupriavidus pauculus]|uniref:DUF1488 domain-containing protein n=1 Tax=Cupriavidus pauculus TaxID=82633 RepID=A0A2N5CDW1_9BURK|nr:hypothetical protein [Cupriavidus pauculus]PLQ00388.1 hypothetical protein CYJ10_12210 [Cupriavidus pauculus]
MVYPIGPKVADVGDDVGVQFDYLIAGSSQAFVVTRQALEEHFKLNVAGLGEDLRDAALYEAFLQGWQRIRNVAARRSAMPNDGRIILDTGDF